MMLTRKAVSASRLRAGMVAVLALLAPLAASAQEPFVGEIRLFAATYCPRGWREADGSALPVWQYRALFSLIGTRYGGDGREHFNLPKLSGRVAVGHGHGPSGYYYEDGATGGSELVTLNAQELPAHSHGIRATPEAGTSSSSVAMGSEAPGSVPTEPIQTTGQSIPHENRPPFLVLRYCVAVDGMYPTRE